MRVRGGSLLGHDGVTRRVVEQGGLKQIETRLGE
jgi:hypothetical protein